MTGKRKFLRRTGAFALVVGMGMSMAGLVAPAANAATSDFAPTDPNSNITITAGGANCNGIIPNSSDTSSDKTLVGFKGGDLNQPQYRVTYPVDASNVGDFSISDCVVKGVAGQTLKQMTVVDQAVLSGVNNSTSFQLDYTVNLTALNLQAGDVVCNVAKNTGAPSDSPAGQRKSGAACFVVGGQQQVQKTDAVTGADVTATPAATFRVSCAYPAGSDPVAEPVLANATAVPATGHVDVQANSLAFNGPSTASCTVQEIGAPDGYDLPTAGTCAGAVVPPACDTINVTIGLGSSHTVIPFADQPTVQTPPVTHTLSITNTVNGDPGNTKFTFHVNCTDDSNQDFPNLTGTGNVGSVTNIVEGAVCTVAQDDPGAGWTTTVKDATESSVQAAAFTPAASIQVTMGGNRTVAFTNTFPQQVTTTTSTTSTTVQPTTTTTAAPTTTQTTAAPAQVLAETVDRPATTQTATPAAAAATASTPAAAAAPTVQSAQLATTGSSVGRMVWTGLVLVAFGLMALLFSRREAAEVAER